MSFAPENESLAKPEALLRVPVGLASPLWGLFAGAAVTGATWWWMTRWARPQNLEAIFAAAETFEAAVEATPTLATPVLEAVEAAEPAVGALVEAVPATVTELVPEPLTEAMAESVVEPMVEPMVEAIVEPVVEAIAEPVVELAAEAPEVIQPEVIQPEVVEPVVIAGGATDVALDAALAPKPKKKAVAPKAD